MRFVVDADDILELDAFSRNRSYNISGEVYLHSWRSTYYCGVELVVEVMEFADDGVSIGSVMVCNRSIYTTDEYETPEDALNEIRKACRRGDVWFYAG